jgi:hypothetical protein
MASGPEASGHSAAIRVGGGQPATPAWVERALKLLPRAPGKDLVRTDVKEQVLRTAATNRETIDQDGCMGGTRCCLLELCGHRQLEIPQERKIGLQDALNLLQRSRTSGALPLFLRSAASDMRSLRLAVSMTVSQLLCALAKHIAVPRDVGAAYRPNADRPPTPGSDACGGPWVVRSSKRMEKRMGINNILLHPFYLSVLFMRCDPSCGDL